MGNDMRIILVALSLAGILFVLLSIFLQTTDEYPVDGAFLPTWDEYPVDGPFLRTAQAPIDEAFESVTSRRNIQDARVDWQKNMPAGFQAKRNSSYPWGTTTYGDSELWVGTIAQGWCVWPVQNLNFPMYLSTYQSEFTGCSAQSVLTTPSLIYVFDLESGTQELIHEGTLTSGGKAYTQATQPHDEMSALKTLLP